MGGGVLARRLRDAQPFVRVLYMSGSPDDPRSARVPRVANSRFLPKPFTQHDLAREVSALFET
jgi:hypothetical protein